MTFCCSAISACHHYRVHKRGLPHVALRRNYMLQLRALLPLPAVMTIEEGSPDPAGSMVMKSLDVVCTSPRPSRRAFARRWPIRVMETPVRIAPRLTLQDPLAAAGAVVLDCRPQALPGAMDVTSTDLAEIPSTSRTGVAAEVPSEREQSFGGGGLTQFDLSGVRRHSIS